MKQCAGIVRRRNRGVRRRRNIIWPGHTIPAIGIAQDHLEAVRWYRAAAENGITAAQYSLAFLYATGTGIARDDREAYIWLSISRVIGDVSTIVLIGGVDWRDRSSQIDVMRKVNWRDRLSQAEIRSAQQEATRRMKTIDTLPIETWP